MQDEVRQETPRGRRDSSDRRLWEEVRDDVKRMASEVGTIGRLRWERVALTAREGAFALLLGVFGAMAMVVVTLVGSVLLVLGTAGGLAALFDSVWAGRLVTGLVIVAGGICGIVLLRKRMERRYRASLERRFGPTPPSPARPQPSPPPVRPETPTRKGTGTHVR